MIDHSIIPIDSCFYIRCYPAMVRCFEIKMDVDPLECRGCLVFCENMNKGDGLRKEMRGETQFDGCAVSTFTSKGVGLGVSGRDHLASYVYCFSISL